MVFIIEWCLLNQISLKIKYLFLNADIASYLFVVEGICENALSAGSHTIEINVGGCAEHRATAKIISGGFNTSSKLQIEEVRLDKALDGGLSIEITEFIKADAKGFLSYCLLIMGVGTTWNLKL